MSTSPKCRAGCATGQFDQGYKVCFVRGAVAMCMLKASRPRRAEKTNVKSSQSSF